MNNDNEVMLEGGELVPVDSSLSTAIGDDAITSLTAQREDLNKFIKKCLVRDVDYGIIPHTGNKPSLFKPGAEKLAKLFHLGSRIVQRDRTVEPEFVMFSYVVEVFHMPTGKPIAQCEGCANSAEKKYKNREPADQMNTLMKMAQKRAYVGAMIIACGASDFFTQDVEDMSFDDRERRPAAPANKRDYSPIPTPVAEAITPKAPPGGGFYMSNELRRELMEICMSSNWTTMDLNAHLAKGKIKSVGEIPSEEVLRKVIRTIETNPIAKAK